jgi:hypothetical protein
LILKFCFHVTFRAIGNICFLSVSIRFHNATLNFACHCWSHS